MLCDMELAGEELQQLAVASARVSNKRERQNACVAGMVAPRARLITRRQVVLPKSIGKMPTFRATPPMGNVKTTSIALPALEISPNSPYH